MHHVESISTTFEKSVLLELNEFQKNIRKHNHDKMVDNDILKKSKWEKHCSKLDLRGLEPDVFEFSAQLQIHYVFNDVTICCVHNASTICVIFPAFNDE
jgi:hypothetical protein